MEVFKDFVKFNRYKSVESFNNAKDITSSTISIVKLDENVMDIYLGRTQLTHSNFPEVNIELRNLIDSLDSKLKNLKTEFYSNLSSLDEEHNKKLSEYVLNFENGLNDLIVFTNNLSKDILFIKSDSKDKHNKINQQIIDITKSITDINESLSNKNDAINELSNKITGVENKNISISNNISNLNKNFGKRTGEWRAQNLGSACQRYSTPFLTMLASSAPCSLTLIVKVPFVSVCIRLNIKICSRTCPDRHLSKDSRISRKRVPLQGEFICYGETDCICLGTYWRRHHQTYHEQGQVA